MGGWQQGEALSRARPGHVLKRTTARPHSCAGSRRCLETKGSVHRSCGRGTACSREPSKRRSRPATAGTTCGAQRIGPARAWSSNGARSSTARSLEV
eukprot:4426156-Pleurochrysis_carterae.AAC.1